MKTHSTSHIPFLRDVLGAGMKIATACAAFCVCAAFPALQASVIFQADFNGTGGGTGGASDIVTTGGTGSLYANTSATTTVQPAPTLGQGTFLNVVVPPASGGAPSNGTIGGVKLTPTTSANSWAAMNTIAGGATGTTLHGGMDFFLREDALSPSGGIGDLIDFGSNNGGGIRLIIQINPTYVRYRLYSGNPGTQGFLTGGSYTNPDENAIVDSNFTLSAGTTYHFGFTMNTDSGTGVSNMSLFARSDTNPIDTTSTADRIGSTNFKINGTNVTAGFSAAQFEWNIGGNSNAQDAANRQVSADVLRLYDSAPAGFAAIPEPGTIGLLGVGLMGLLALARRKKA